MFDKKILTALIILLLGSNVWALRVARPLTLTYPITEDQVSQLNRFLENVVNMQEGRFEIDIVTTTKTNAKNGEFWILNSGGVYKWQYRANDTVHTITPD